MKSLAVIIQQSNPNLIGALLGVKVAEVDMRKPGADEVLVKMEAAPCNPSDIAFMRGGYNIQKPFPAVPGFEGTGVVVETGSEARELQGKRVSCFLQDEGFGTWSAYFLAKAQNCIIMKDAMPVEQAACFSINPLTAYAMFEMTGSSGANAFILNAAGGQVPRLMRVFAKKHSMEVINLVRKETMVESLMNEGENYVLNTASEDFFTRLKQLCHQLQPTIAFDAAGGEATGKILNAMPNGGRIVVYGALSGADLSGIDPMGIIFRSKSIRGFNLNDWVAGLKKADFKRITDELQEMFIAGELKTQIQSTFPLGQAIDGIRHYIKNMSAGKVLFTS
ncbi:MAG: alcohol dehydrogenase catalytic domain-containing protein [Bacteroidales bacterium]